MIDAGWLVLAAIALVAAAGCLVRLCIRDLWDAILAVAVFIALFALAGEWLSRKAEHWIDAYDLLSDEMSRVVIVASAGLIAAAMSVAAACAAVTILRWLSPKARRQQG